MSPGTLASRRVAESLAHLRIVAVVAFFLLAVAALSACSASPQNATPLANIEPDGDGFNGTLVDPPLQIAPIILQDTAGDPVRLDRTEPGKATAFFFGFTNCDDICPTTMADLAAAQRSLPAELANRVTLVFITVDPQRDKPDELREWLDQFDPEIIGLRGPKSAIHRAERSLYSSESGKAPPAPLAGASSEGDHTSAGTDSSTHGLSPDDYEVNHSSVVYLFGPDGRTVLYTGNATPSAYAEDLIRLLRRT